MALGSDAFIDLEYVHACPWDVLFGKSTKHHPWHVPSADSHDETAAGGNGLARLRGDHRGGFLSYCIRVGKDFNSHGSSPLRSWSSQAAGEYGTEDVSSFAAGLCQPPAGLSRSASAGPQVCGSYSYIGVPALSAGSTMRHASST